jgi:hypothetical protein
MGIRKHLNFGKAAKVIKASQNDMARKPAKVVKLDDRRQQKNGGQK